MSLQELKILPTKGTPEIILNPNGFVKIGGRSMVGDVTEFGKKIDDWINEYICNPADLTRVDFHLEYLNTNNIKFYISLLKKIETIKLKNKRFMINWYYEEGDEDILEKGKYISSHLDIPFNFIKTSDQNILSL